jgi:hypothetical protein
MVGLVLLAASRLLTDQVLVVKSPAAEYMLPAETASLHRQWLLVPFLYMVASLLVGRGEATAALARLPFVPVLETQRCAVEAGAPGLSLMLGRSLTWPGSPVPFRCDIASLMVDPWEATAVQPCVGGLLKVPRLLLGLTGVRKCRQRRQRVVLVRRHS